MKAHRGKLSASIAVSLIGGLALVGLVFIEDLRIVTGISIIKLNASRLHGIYNSTMILRRGGQRKTLEDRMNDEDAKVMFDPKWCSVTDGKWVFNESKHLPYDDTTCPYIDKQVSCGRNGRPDKEYLYWEWKLDNCTLPRFDAKSMLEKIRGKRMMFVGDSLQRAQWASIVCLVHSVIPASERYMRNDNGVSVYTAMEYNATIEFYWAPFLIESNTDGQIIADPNRRILHVDAIANHAQHWVGVDILVFETYIWWMSGQTIKSVWGSFANGEEGYEELDSTVAYKIGLKTWANWIDSALDPNKTKIFFTTISPTHMRSADWNHNENIRCFNETKPVLRKGYRGTGTDQRMMDIVSSVVARMKTPVTFLNVTQLSEHRIDGHVSVYTESQGKVLTDEQKADPEQYVDCIHWCLPGVPDTWNQLLYAYL
ncbi:protein trichome birefringence-like 3 isoform X1 [Carex littledalei]|uniref:Protein trichome birefringence-like 3 isoform X1 n=1 Tax=Carex littledalei TaxID=544730 RepID=A0A833R4F8_9POAL|nr:protein trichome birefringence-like 3 isoform X1 [Carex littledalei]